MSFGFATGVGVVGGPRKNMGIDFDSKLHALSIGGEFRAIPALLPRVWKSYRKKYFVVLNFISPIRNAERVLRIHSN